MKFGTSVSPHRYLLLLAGLGILIIAASMYVVFTLNAQRATITALQAERATLLGDTASSTLAASSTIVALQTELNALKAEYGILNEDYSSEQDRNDDFQKQIKKITKTVGVLDKLSKTDEELLQKYSKVYFLNEHYVPEKLSSLPKDTVYDENKDHNLHFNVLPYFKEMVADAKGDGIDLWVVSSYRSFAQQAALKGQYVITYGSGANTFSADQGYSEHQLGTTVDFTTKGIGGGLNGFAGTPAFTWLQANAYKYGFTLSYPENNSYYEYEPWHWRFVGEDLARDLHKANAHFYDWDQRKIDSYLISIFD